MKNILRALIITIILVLLIVGGIKAVKQKKAQEASLPPAKIYTIKVKSIKPKESNITLSLPVVAIVANDSNVNLSSKVSQRIEEVTKKRGDRVSKGEVLVKLDTRDIDAKISSLKSKIYSLKVNLNNLISIHKRSQELLKVDGVSIEQFEKEATSISSLRAQIKSLMANLAQLHTLKSYTILKSPIDGVVSKIFANVGDMAMPGKPIMEITSPKDSYIVVRVPDSIEAKSLIFRGKEYKLTPLNSTFNSLIEYKTPSIANLIKGQRVDGNLIVYKDRGILLPNDLILNRDGKEYVVVVDGKIAKAIKISVVAKGSEGVVVKNPELIGKDVVSAKPDILLKLLSGIPAEIIK